MDLEKRTITGILVPDEILNSEQDIQYQLSDSTFFVFPIKKVKEGMPFYINLFFCIGADGKPQQPINLKFVIEDKRMYVIDTIRYLLNDQVIGIINKNKWLLINDQYLNYYSDDKCLEIIDWQGRVALSIQFKSAKDLYFKGYFISKDFVSVYGNNSLALCISKKDSNYREKAIDIISTIKPLHNYEND